MKRLLIPLFTSLLFFSFSAPGQNATTDATMLMEQANAAYQQKQYQQAIQQYEQLVASGLESVVLYYNLGNSYYRNNQIGRSILNYEKALRLDGTDEDIQHNLQVARARSKNEIVALPSFFLTRWWGKVRSWLGSGVWAGIGLLLFWLGVAGLVYWLLASVRAEKKKGFVIGMICLLVSVLPFGLAFSRAQWDADSSMAIVLTESLPLRSAPDADSNEIVEVYEGLKVELLDQIGNWSKVRLMNGEQGWLPIESYEKI